MVLGPHGCPRARISVRGCDQDHLFRGLSLLFNLPLDSQGPLWEPTCSKSIAKICLLCCFAALLALLDSPSQPTKVPTKQQETYTQHVSTITPTLHQTTMQQNATHRSKILRKLSLGHLGWPIKVRECGQDLLF